MTDFDDIEIKENFKEIRAINEKNKNLIENLTELNEICFGKKENLEYEKDKLEDLKKEIEYRKQKLKEVEKKFSSINQNEHSEDNLKKYILELKNEMIKKNLEGIFSKHLPELVHLYNNQSQELNCENDFFNLVFDHVIICFNPEQKNTKLKENLNNMINNKENMVQVKQSFKISKKTTFKNLKSAACQFWNLPNEKEFYIFDDSEALIFDEEMPVEKFLKDYSVLINRFMLINIKVAGSRYKLSEIQDHKIRSENTFLIDQKNFENEGKINNGQKPKDNAKSVKDKIKIFLNEFMGIRNYLKNNGNEKEIDLNENPEVQNVFNSNLLINNMETSFPMMIILIFLYIFTLTFLYSSHSISLKFSFNNF